ncbi:MAG TPA: alpha/beta hydrolase [Opitutaceae bacterium]|nr:alpha/beta hydrolase [Opitutaceae bacterium]
MNRGVVLRCAGIILALAGALLRGEPGVMDLWPEGVPGLRADAAPEKTSEGRVSNVHHPTLAVYPAPAGSACGTAVIICPGGGYGWLSMEKEGTEPARWFNALGVTAFVLKYRLAEYGHPAPLRDVLRAVRLVRSRAAEFGVRADRMGVMGFSAGGHLASCAGTLYDAPEGRTGAPLDAVSARPDFLMLIYPVITLQDPYTHAGSRRNLLGEHPTEALIGHLSTELQVTKNTPPAFLLTSFEDHTVPAENSIGFFTAMHRAGVPAELHAYERGPHGIGLRPGFGPISDWPKLAEQWLRLHGWLTPPGG